MSTTSKLCWLCGLETDGHLKNICQRCWNAMDFKTPDDLVNLVVSLSERIERLENKVKELSNGRGTANE